MSHKLKPEKYLEFITGGNALFTMRNSETGKRFTYKVGIPEDKKPENATIWFVRGLVGPDNENSYKYFGCLKKDPNGKFFFEFGRKSKIGQDAPIVVAFDYVFNKLVAHGFTKPNLEIWHEGRCCRCGRTLTVPESIESGIGPECAKISNLKTSIK